MKNMKCNHFNNKLPSVYIYPLIGAELCLCPKCEKKLRQRILEQDKIEKECSS